VLDNVLYAVRLFTFMSCLNLQTEMRQHLFMCMLCLNLQTEMRQQLRDVFNRSHNLRMISKLDIEEKIQREMWAEWVKFIEERRSCSDVGIVCSALNIINRRL